MTTRRWLRPALVITLTLLISFEVLRQQHYFMTIYPDASAKQWQDGYLQTASYVESVRDKYVFVYVDNFDDRFFLYYLPSSGLSWQEIQKSPSHDFKRTVFRNVIIDRINDWETLEKDSLVITTADRLPADKTVKEIITGATGKERFVATETPRN